MENLQGPAFPISEVEYNRFSGCTGPWTGFTKLEYAAILIAQGLANYYSQKEWTADLPRDSVFLAKAVIEECNK